VRIRNSVIERWAARAAVAAASVLFFTVRKELHLAEPEANPYQLPVAGTYIFSVWHDSLLMPLFFGKQPRTMALVGLHQDGSFLANTMAALNISAVRGSSSRGGAVAVRRLLAEKSDHHLVVTPDGPRGPRREMKQGVAYLASRTGRPVVPTAFACRRFWSVGTGWTDLVIPKPWTRVVALSAQAIHVPADADRDVLDDYTARIQQAMDRLNTQATDMVAQPPRSVQQTPASNVPQETRSGGVG